MAFASIGPTSKSLWTLDPRTLPGCVLWLDANDSNTLVLSGSNVTTWNDKSEFGFSMSASAGTGSVTYSSNGFNGLPTILFADNGRFCNAMQRYLFNSNVTAAVVFQKTGSDGTTYADSVIGRYFSESAPIFAADTSGTGNVRIIGNGTTTRTLNASGGFSLRAQRPNIYVFQTGSDLSWNEFWNGTQQSIGAATDVGTPVYSDASSGNVLSIGGFGTTTRRTFNGAISEVILFNTRLDRFERQRLEGYLANKWNMVYALPSNHPFGTSFLKNVISAPTAVPTCSAWYDAGDVTSITRTGSSVTQWLDKVSRFHLSTSGTGSPTYNSNSGDVNIEFNGTGNFFDISAGAQLVANTSYTIFVTEQRGGNPGTGNFFLFGGGTAAAFSNLHIGYRGSNLFTYALFASDINISYALFNSNTERYQVWAFLYDGTKREIYSNGTLLTVSSNAQALLAWPNPYVGRYGPTSAFYRGKMREIVFYKSGLTSTQRESVEDYLGYKWGFYSNSSNLAQFRSTKPAFFRSFTPLDISGCIGWYDAADSTTITLSGTVDVSGWRNKAQVNTDNLVNVGTRLPKYQVDPSTGLNSVYIDTCSAAMASTVSNAVTGNTFFCTSRFNSFINPTSTQMLFGLPDVASGDMSTRTIPTDPYWDLAFANASNTMWTPAANGSLYYNGAGPLTLSGRTAPVGNSHSILSVTTGVAGTSRTGLSSTFLNRGVRDTYYYEFLRYNRTLSSNERQAIEGYLANKWNLTDKLPGTHPYSLYYGNRFLPTDIPTCRAWYDAADSTTLTLSGQGVLTWRDKTGNGYDLSAIPVAYPTYVSNQFVDFGAGNTSGLFILNASSMVVNASFTIVVLEQRGTGTGSNYFMGGSGTGTNSNLQFGYRNDSTVRFGFWANDLDVSVDPYVTTQTYNAWTALYNRTARQIYINNSLIASSNTTQDLLDWSNAFIGRFPQGTNFYNGRMREILFFRSGLTAAQLSNVHSYLAWKWNLQWKIPTTSTISNLVPPNAESFSPLQVSNLSLWLDGSDPNGNGVIPADGASVPIWYDKSGNGRNASDSVGNPPSYSSNYRALDFNGTTQAYNTINLSANPTSATFFSVFRSTGGTPNIITATGGISWRVESTSRLFSIIKAGTAGSLTSAVGISADLVNTYLFDSYFTSNVAGSALLAIDGSTYSSNNTTAFTTLSNNTYVIGTTTARTSFYQGQMMELLMYQNRILTTEERLKIQGYLAHKWGINNKLPDAHPYKRINFA
jgi:hypothetical protein